MACLRLSKDPIREHKIGSCGFTLLEVMIAMAVIAIALTAVLGSQSQSVSLATEAKFTTTATLLAQYKLAEFQTRRSRDLVAESGDFGEDFPGYTWKVAVEPVLGVEPEGVSDHLQQIDVTINWGGSRSYTYPLRFFGFYPKSR